MKFMLERRAHRLAAILRPHLPDAGTLLDIGCGTGHNCAELQRHGHLHCVEADVADMKVVGPRPVLFAGTTLPFRSQSFDCTIMTYVVHYASDPQGLLKEARRVTRGRLLLLQSTCTTPLSCLLLRAREWASGRIAFRCARWCGLIRTTGCPLSPKTYFTRSGLSAIVKAAGWTITEHHVVGSVPFGPARDLFVLEKANE